MPSRFPWAKAAPAQFAERPPAAAPDPSRHVPPPRQFPEAYYEEGTLRELVYTAPATSSSQGSSRPNSAFGVHAGKEQSSLGGQPYEQQHLASTLGSGASSQQSPINKKSFKTRLGIGGASSSGEDIQESVKEVPAAKGIFGRKKSVVKRKEAPPALSRGSSSTVVEHENRGSSRSEDKRQPPPQKDSQGFEPFGPNFTRDQLQGYHPSGNEASTKLLTESYSRSASSPVTSTFPQAQYQIFHQPVIQETQALVHSPLPTSRRASTEGSVLSNRHSQNSSRPSSRQSHNYQPQPQQQNRAYEGRTGPQQATRREESDAMPAPTGMRQQRQSQSYDHSKLNSPGQVSRENSTMNSNSLRQGEQTSIQGSHGASDENPGRRSPPLPRSAREMSDADVNRLLKDHNELRAKYNNVKRQYFEKKDQVEGLQDSLAQQRLSQSRTCLDDGEYIARMTRLDGLVSQLAFIVRKDWKAIPDWLQSSVNRDALQIGKQEMTAVGRAVISRWLAQELFDKYFHPGLEPSLSSQLKNIQRTIWMGSLPCHSAEDEESLISKIISWRLTTAEGLKGLLSSTDALSNRQLLTHMLSQQLLEELRLYLDDQAAGSLEGGITMIVELAISILANLPLESRDVSIEYFPPGYPILPDLMKLESGIPALSSNTASASAAAEAEADRLSMQSSDSPSTESYEGEAEMSKSHELLPQKKGLFGIGGGSGGGSGSSSGGGGGKKSAANSSQKMTSTGGSGSGSGSSGGAGSGAGAGQQKTPSSPRGGEDQGRSASVRLCAFLAVQIRGKMVLVKAPVFKV